METEPMSYGHLAHIEAHLEHWQEIRSQPNNYFHEWVNDDDVRALIDEIKRLRKLVGEPYPGMEGDQP